MSYLAWLGAKEGNVNGSLRVSHHPQPHDSVPLQSSWTQNVDMTLDVRTRGTTVVEVMDDEPLLQMVRQHQPRGSRWKAMAAVRDRFKKEHCLEGKRLPNSAPHSV